MTSLGFSAAIFALSQDEGLRHGGTEQASRRGEEQDGYTVVAKERRMDLSSGEVLCRPNKLHRLMPYTALSLTTHFAAFRMDQQENEFLDTLHDFLCRKDVEELITLHPNITVAPDFVLPQPWLSWWDWAGDVIPGTSQDVEPKWQLLWRYYIHDSPSEDDFDHIPTYLRRLLREARCLQLCRERGKEAVIPGQEGCDLWFPSDGELSSLNTNLHGMSPKKAHEVQFMSKYAAVLLSKLGYHGISVQHVVDVGAGQAYLSRTLRDDCGLNVLAVDWSPVQEQGAARREERDKRLKKRSKRTPLSADRLPSVTSVSTASGSLSYRKIVITSQSLVAVTSEWTQQSGRPHKTTDLARSRDVPVFLVGLHACGSLTLDILRAVVEQLRVNIHQEKCWTPAGGLIVGCCYNLLREEDCVSQSGRKIRLSANHLQLAAQIPSQWARTTTALADATLAFRKLSWRALLARIIFNISQERPTEGGSAPQLKRLGRLNDSVYSSWESFLSAAENRLNVKVTGDVARDLVMESRLEVFHFIRCILGPVVESFLLLDRKIWLQHQLEGVGMRVHLVNLFDQSSGSARNVGIVILPHLLW